MYLYYSEKCKNKKLLCGQVATILTLVIGAIFVFMVLTWNMRKVTMKKTMIDNAVDGAALFMASQLGSIATRMAYDIFGSATTEKCNYDWWLIATAAIMALTLPLQIMTGFGFTGLLFTIGSMAFKVAASLVAGSVYNIIWKEPNAYKNTTGYLRYLTLEQQICEGAIAQVFFCRCH